MLISLFGPTIMGVDLEAVAKEIRLKVPIYILSGRESFREEPLGFV